ncbi:SRPBCC family protein [Bacillus sp. FJAT-45350]|uniref:SRPBCC family protein n=1 Tax=Bacillus sp. FJAT-45350 TaxID=2011014 RepID=UPI000BB80B77|nr:SRPBCC family protein [Bacillus sp. FJAT-45350]
MGKHTFYYETYIDSHIDNVWDFFSTAENLAKITSFPKVRILSNPATVKGNIIEMELNFRLFKMAWSSDITEVVEKSYFIDVGKVVPFPFKEWRHVHAFEEKGNGTLMKDTVTYEAIMPGLFVQQFLKGMFSSREKEIRKYFS